MNRHELSERIEGKKISRIEWADELDFGEPAGDQPVIDVIVLDDGTRLRLEGSAKVDCVKVWTEIDA